jgi:drug/metabolite transporter (DMT)-like permease
MKNSPAEIRGIIYIILSGFLYGFLGFFGVNALQSSADIANMLFWRFFISGVFIAIFLVPKIKNIKMDLPLMLTILTASAIFYGSSTFAYFTAVAHIGTGLAMVIFFTYPAIVVLCNRFFYRSQIDKGYYVSVILILMGLLLLAELGSDFNYQGILLSLISASGYAFYIMMSKKNNQLDPLLSALMVSIGCCFFCFIYAFSAQTFFVPKDPVFWLNSLGLGIVATALPILLLLKGLKYISSEKASILGVLEPVFVVFFGVLLLKEKLLFIQVIGIVVILGGALLSLCVARAPK